MHHDSSLKHMRKKDHHFKGTGDKEAPHYDRRHIKNIKPLEKKHGFGNFNWGDNKLLRVST